MTLLAQGTPFEQAAVDHVNLEIEEGEMVGVIGHTGSGQIYPDPASQRPFEADLRQSAT